MKRILLMPFFLLMGLTNVLSQSAVPPPDEPDYPWGPVTSCGDQFTLCANITTSIQWVDGVGKVTVSLPFNLDNTKPINFGASTNFTHNVSGKNIDFVFFSYPFKGELKLEYEDLNYRYGYVDTSAGHSCFAYKLKYKILITFM